MDNTRINLIGDRKRRAENAARALKAMKKGKGCGCECDCSACKAKHKK